VLELGRTVAFEKPDGPPPILVAGICGQLPQALREAALASELGYHAGLVSLAALRDAPDDQLIAHCREIAAVVPVFGFYLQPAVGGRLLGYRFWREFLEIEGVVAIKVAPFNRYHTLDVVRALAESGRQHEVALYSGNDDNIIVDLLADHRVGVGTDTRCVRFAGGLLGQWAVWTRRAVEQLEMIKACRANRDGDAREILARAAGLTDANAALFDVRHGFAGCIAGLHEILRRQGLMAGRWCLDPDEDVSPGQMEEIDRVCRAYPELQDDEFVAAHLDEWLG
jgi:dihydrodipicolinate synthase/N-acetylneuraminate lyase